MLGAEAAQHAECAVDVISRSVRGVSQLAPEGFEEPARQLRVEGAAGKKRLPSELGALEYRSLRMTEQGMDAKREREGRYVRFGSSSCLPLAAPLSAHHSRAGVRRKAPADVVWCGVCAVLVRTRRLTSLRWRRVGSSGKVEASVCSSVQVHRPSSSRVTFWLNDCRQRDKTCAPPRVSWVGGGGQVGGRVRCSAARRESKRQQR